MCGWEGGGGICCPPPQIFGSGGHRELQFCTIAWFKYISVQNVILFFDNIFLKDPPFWNCYINVSHAHPWIIYNEFPELIDSHRLRFTNFTEQRGLAEYNIFVDSLRIHTAIVINKLYIHIFYIWYPSPCIWLPYSYSLFNLTKSTIVNHRLGQSSTFSWQTPCRGEKRKKYLKNLLPFYMEQIVISVYISKL